MSGALTGRRILITGAAKGIGLASVRALHCREGARIAALDRDEVALAALRGRFDRNRSMPAKADVADPASVIGRRG
jgi:NAD(P)-dependent dehydrogenase (short-subunit alcohol dehydrogenase family)